MRCADDALLWRAAEGSLEAGARAELELHLTTCATCADALAAVGTTRLLLRQAAAAPPDAEVDWRRADEQVLTAAAAHLARPRFRLPIFRFAFAAAGAAAVALLAVWLGGGPAPSAPGVTSPSPAVRFATVESAEGAHVTEVAGAEEALATGDGLEEGARVRTSAQGSAVLRLPDRSRALVGAHSAATVRRARADDVALTLESGDLVVEASHAPRTAFVVDAGLAQIRVVGTAFRVRRAGDRVEVSVAEGRVLVEPRQGDARLLGAGERLILGADGAILDEAAALNEEDGRAFAALGITALLPAAQAEDPGPLAAAPKPPRSRSTPGPAPAAPAAPVIAEVQQAPAPKEPGAHEDWATPEFKGGPAAVAAKAPGLAERAQRSGLPITAEGLFLQRAEESLKGGHCGNFLVGLADVVEASEDVQARERARILRARCYDERLDPARAESEYRKYLADFPRGRHAAEARAALPAE